MDTHRDVVSASDVYRAIENTIDSVQIGENVCGKDSAFLFQLLDRVAPTNCDEAETVRHLRNVFGLGVDCVLEIPDNRVEWFKGKMRQVKGFRNSAESIPTVLSIFEMIGLRED